ncbi:YqeG family HAD IIIA-type phosphatase [Flavonifractor plautii]|nr:YqeG family HAD IIIA-type phosphatase [Flavonifractor plautii]
MALPILAHWAGRSIFDIEPAALARRGIRLLLADLDNTLAPYGEPEPTQAVRDWAAALGEQGSPSLCSPTTGTRSGPAGFPRRWACPSWATRASRSRGLPAGHGADGLHAGADCHRGDQLFTDILGGRNAGVLTLLVEPIRLAGNPGRYLRYGAEWPFRMWSKRRTKPL